MPVISTGYVPRPLQQMLHAKLKRFNVIVCHRRFGKTVFAVNEIIDQAVRCPRKNPQYAYIGPSYGQVKRVAWDYAKDFTRNLPGVKFNEAELRIEIPRPQFGDKIKIMLLSGENPDSLRGLYLDGSVLDEYAEMNPVVWSQVIRPALSDRIGWANFIGTPKGKNHFYDIYDKAQDADNWFSCVLKASETNIIAPEELVDARHTMSPEEYAQEYECDFGAALVGSYFGPHISKVEREGRICSVPYDMAHEVQTFWDLGLDDQTAIWFMQEIGSHFNFVDYFEASNADFTKIAGMLKAKDYLYGRHYLPHDAAQREQSSGNTRKKILEDMGIKPITIVERHKVEDGISAARLMLSRSRFDAVKCKTGLDALRNYQRKWDAKDKTFVAHPLHNWASHGADSYRQFAMGFKEANKRGAKNLPDSSETSYNVFDY